MEATESKPFNPWIVTLVISMATFMEVLDTSIANVSLRHIAGGLAAGLDESTWVLTTYLVANAVMMPISGWLSTVIGTKRFYMICVATFTASSLCCGMAPTLEWLIFFRLLQGIGGAGLAPVVQAMLADIFPPEKRGLAFSLYGLSVVFAPAIGPTLGGWITDNYSWHWIFLINVPIGILSLVLTSLIVQEPHAAMVARKNFLKNGLRVDFVGFGLTVLGLGCLEYFVDRGEREDWFSSPVITLMAVIAATSLICLVIWELGQKDPMVDIPLLKRPSFLGAFVLMFFMGFILFGTTALLPQFLEQLLGYTAQQAGIALTAGGVFLIFMMPLVGAVLIPRFEFRTLIMTGLVIQALSLWNMSFFNLGITFDQAVAARVFQVSGIALVFAPVTQGSYIGLPPGKNNNASALINLARNLGGSVGIAISSTILAQRSQFHQSRLVESISDFNAQTGPALQHLQHTAGLSPQQAIGFVYAELQRQAAMLSYIDVFLVMTVMTIAALPLVFVMQRKNPPPRPNTPVH